MHLHLIKMTICLLMVTTLVPGAGCVYEQDVDSNEEVSSSLLDVDIPETFSEHEFSAEVVCSATAICIDGSVVSISCSGTSGNCFHKDQSCNGASSVGGVVKCSSTGEQKKCPSYLCNPYCDSGGPCEEEWECGFYHDAGFCHPPSSTCHCSP